jgi:DNA polymerase III sliding clamp (beta) subunit (PCNA family)
MDQKLKDTTAPQRTTAEMVARAAQVSRAASRDESRPVLTGILVRFEAATLEVLERKR